MQKITKAILASAGMAVAILAPNNSALAREQFYNIRARHSGQCLNVLDAGYRNGDNVVQGEECRADSFQWSVVPVSRSHSRPHDSRYDRDRPRRERKYNPFSYRFKWHK